jgi:hypothetical protein
LKRNLKNLNLFILLIFRFVGGVPFSNTKRFTMHIQCKSLQFFLVYSFRNIASGLFLIISIGSGLEEIIDQNLNAPSVIDLITSPSIYIPLIAFFALLLITIFFRKAFYKN